MHNFNSKYGTQAMLQQNLHGNKLIITLNCFGLNSLVFWSVSQVQSDVEKLKVVHYKSTECLIELTKTCILN